MTVTPYVDEDDHERLALLPPPPEGGNSGIGPAQLPYEGLGIKPRALCYAVSPAVLILSHFQLSVRIAIIQK